MRSYYIRHEKNTNVFEFDKTKQYVKMERDIGKLVADMLYLILGKCPSSIFRGFFGGIPLFGSPLNVTKRKGADVNSSRFKKNTHWCFRVRLSKYIII